MSEVMLDGSRRIEGAPSPEATIAIDASRELKSYKSKPEEFAYYGVYKGSRVSVEH